MGCLLTACMCNLQIGVFRLPVCQALLQIMGQGSQHDGLGLLHGPGLCKCIQLFSLDGEHRLYLEQGSQSCRGRGNPASLFQIFKSVHRNINGAVKPGCLQLFLYLFTTPSQLCQSPGIQGRLSLCNGNPLVVHHLDAPLILFCQHKGCLTGTAESAGHGNVHHLIMILQKLLPLLHHVFWRGLGCGDVGAFLHPSVKFFVA